MWLILFFLFTGTVWAQPTPSTVTLADQVYAPGKYESAPVAITNKARATHVDEIDVTNFTDPKICLVFGSDIIDKDGKRRGGGRGGVCGQKGGFKDRDGQPKTTPIQIGGGRVDPGDKIVSVLIVQGSSIKTKMQIFTEDKK